MNGIWNFLNITLFSDVQTDTSGLDVDSSDDEGDYDVEAEDEDVDLPKDLKGFNITSEYSPKQIRVEELVKLAPLFPELNDCQVQTDTKFTDSVFSSNEGKIWILHCYLAQPILNCIVFVKFELLTSKYFPLLLRILKYITAKILTFRVTTQISSE